MTRWQDRGGWPLAVASLGLAAGIVFGVKTVKVEQPDPPAATVPEGRTITTDEFVADVASAVAEELGRPLTPGQQRRVVARIVPADGQPGVVIVPSPPTTTTSTTTTAPPPTTRPPAIHVDPSLIPDIGDIVNQALDDYSFPTVP